MSDELETVSDGVLAASLYDDSPFVSAHEAQQAMTMALTLMRTGHEAQQQGRGLLEIARRRGAAELLGFTTWEDCLASGLSDVLGIKIEKAARVEIAARLRMEGLSTKDIAAQTFVNPATTARDLTTGRQIGLLDDEPETVPAQDGKIYPARRPSTPNGDDGADDEVTHLPPAPRKPPRRPDLYKSWRNRTDELARVGRSLASMREDDRYSSRLEDLASGTGHDLRTVHDLLTAILQDFTITDKDDSHEQ